MVPEPGGKPCPSGVRMSMSQESSACSEIGLPRAWGRAADEPDVPDVPEPPVDAERQPARASGPTSRHSPSSADRILHLAGRFDGPWEDPVVMLDEARDRANLPDVRD